MVRAEEPNSASSGMMGADLFLIVDFSCEKICPPLFAGGKIDKKIDNWYIPSVNEGDRTNADAN